MKPKDVFYTCEESSYNEFAANLLEQKFLGLQGKNGKINIAVSGGSTPLPIFEILKNRDLSWIRFNFFLVDERCVPLNSDSSNYKNINDIFFKHIAAENYSMMKEGFEISEAIDLFNKSLVAELELDENGIPIFDLILLGMGEDGHTASLFPRTEALSESVQLTVRNYVPQLDSYRITLTYPVLKNAREAIILIKGTKKKAIVKKLYTSEAKQYPIYELVESTLKLNWIISE